MPHTITVSIKMFGAFRKYHPDILTIDAPAGVSVADIKVLLATKLRQINTAFIDDELIGKSVLADNQRIMSADETINTPLSLAILPPVCGG